MHPQIGDAGSQATRQPAARVSHDAVLAWMREHLASLLGVVPDDLDPHENFLDLGVDSVQAMALLEALAGELQITLAPEVFFDSPDAGGALGLPDRRLPGAARPEPAAARRPPEACARRHAVERARPWSRGSRCPRPSRPPRSPPRRSTSPIIGMRGRFPGARTLDQFWKNISEGVDSITDVPKDRWDADAIYDPDPRAPGKTYLRQGGFIDDIYDFAPLFFHLSPREAAFIDPQQRLFLEVAWETIEGAGYGGASLRGSRTGVYVGVSSGEFLQSMITRQCEMVSYVGTGNSPSIIPNRISYHLNLRGPSLALDTACSSSLVAMHLACESLARGETDYALAGAVGLTLHHGKWVYFSKAGMLSIDGRCKTFDASANGYVPGEGIAAVLLKPLDDAAPRPRHDPRHHPGHRRQPGRPHQRDHRPEPARPARPLPGGLRALRDRPVHHLVRRGARHRHAARRPDRGLGAVAGVRPVHGPQAVLRDRLAQDEHRAPGAGGRRRRALQGDAGDEAPPVAALDPLRRGQPAHPLRGDAVLPRRSAPGVGVGRAAPRDGQRLLVRRRQRARGGRGAAGTGARAGRRRPAGHRSSPSPPPPTRRSPTWRRAWTSTWPPHPELALADVAFTLNVGRDHFDRRLALVVESMDDLRRELGRAGERIGGAERAEGQRRRRKTRQPAYVFGGDTGRGPGSGVDPRRRRAGRPRPLRRGRTPGRRALAGRDALRLAGRARPPLGVVGAEGAGGRGHRRRRAGCRRGPRGALLRGRATPGPGRRLDRPRLRRCHGAAPVAGSARSRRVRLDPDRPGRRLAPPPRRDRRRGVPGRPRPRLARLAPPEHGRARPAADLPVRAPVHPGAPDQPGGRLGPGRHRPHLHGGPVGVSGARSPQRDAPAHRPRRGRQRLRAERPLHPGARRQGRPRPDPPRRRLAHRRPLGAGRRARHQRRGRPPARSAAGRPAPRATLAAAPARRRPARSRSAPTSCSPTTASPSTSSGASRRAAAG